MQNKTLPQPKTGLRSLAIATALFACISSGYAQQTMNTEKDNTRPETTIDQYKPVLVTTFTATRQNGINEIKWNAANQQDTKKYIVEYSIDGIDYLTAGEILTGTTTGYLLTHRLLDEKPLLYRIRSEQMDGKYTYSQVIYLDGVSMSPVKIYPTVINGNALNVISQWSVERIVVTSGNGTQAFAKEVNGQKDYISLVLPSLGKGMYFITFYGNDWKTTDRFIVP